jgi:serine/threonine protein kinase
VRQKNQKSLVRVRLPEVGDLLVGEYLLIETIARGGMGIVFLAEQQSMARQVAVKVLLPHAIQDDAHRQRFDREIRVIQQLKHPNIIELLDFAHTDDGNHFLVTEYLVGRDLKSLVKRVGPMAAGRALRLMLHVAKGLTEAHGANIVHRDLKPANIFVCDSKDGEFAKVLDFGIAKSLDSGEPEVTKQGEVCGTTAYLAPEAILGHAGGKQVDVYSIGLILLELLLGRKVFHGRTIAETLVKQLRQNPPIPEVFVGTAIADLVLKSTAKDPGNRYPDATALVGALEFALNTVNPFRRATAGQVDELFSSLGVPIAEPSWPQPSGVQTQEPRSVSGVISKPQPVVAAEPTQAPYQALVLSPSLPKPAQPLPLPETHEPLKDFEALALEASVASQQLLAVQPEPEPEPGRRGPVTEPRSRAARFTRSLSSKPVVAWLLVAFVWVVGWSAYAVLFPDEPRAPRPSALPTVGWKSTVEKTIPAEDVVLDVDLVGTSVTSSPQSVEAVVDESTVLTTPFRAFLTRDTAIAFRRKGYRTQTVLIQASSPEGQHIVMEDIQAGSGRSGASEMDSPAINVPSVRGGSSVSPAETRTKPRKKKRSRLRVKKL